MSAVIEIVLAVWILWAALFVLGLCAAAARPIPQPVRARVSSSKRLPVVHQLAAFGVEIHAHAQFK